MEYKHLRSDTRRCVTFAIKPPTTTELLSLLPYAANGVVKIDVFMGYAECSVNDFFTKKVGRELATKRFKAEAEKTFELLEFQLIKHPEHSILFTDFLYGDFVITFRSFVSKEYTKTDCHNIKYWSEE